jgi:hypothetical protein
MNLLFPYNSRNFLTGFSRRGWFNNADRGTMEMKLPAKEILNLSAKIRK